MAGNYTLRVEAPPHVGSYIFINRYLSDYDETLLLDIINRYLSDYDETLLLDIERDLSTCSEMVGSTPKFILTKHS